MNTEINWSKYRFGDGILCEFKPRETYKGRQLKRNLAEKTGVQFTLSTLWLMDENDPYPGEYALATVSRKELFKELGIAWVASGDVIIIGEPI